MIEHSKLQSLITHITHASKKRSLKSNIMHPQREWAIGLGVASVLLVCVTGVSFYFYVVSITTPEFTSGQVNTVVPYRATVIEAALEEYRDRELRYQNLSQSSIGPVPEVFFDTATSSEGDEDAVIIHDQDQVVDAVNAAEVDDVQSIDKLESENSAASSETLPALETPMLAN